MAAANGQPMPLSQPQIQEIISNFPPHIKSLPQEQQMELLRNLLMDQAKNKMSPMQQGQRQMQGMASTFPNGNGMPMRTNNNPSPMPQPSMQLTQDQMNNPQIAQLLRQQNPQMPFLHTAAQQQYLQTQSQTAQAQLAAAAVAVMSNNMQTPSLRPNLNPLPSQQIQRSPSAAQNVTPVLQQQPNPLQAQALQMQLQGQMRPMRPLGANMGNGGMVGQMQPQGQGRSPGRPMMGNMAPRNNMMNGQSGQIARDSRTEIAKMMLNPPDKQMIITIFANLELFQEKKRNNTLTPTENRCLNLVLSVGPDVLATIKQEGVPNPQQQGMQNQVPVLPQQQRGPMPQMTQEQLIQHQLNMVRPPSMVNGQVSVMANRNAMQQTQGLPMAGQFPGGIPTQQPIQNQQMGGARPTQTPPDMEQVYMKLIELGEEKCKEWVAKGHGSIRKQFYDHISKKVPEDKKIQIFLQHPWVAEGHQAYLQEQAGLETLMRQQQHAQANPGQFNAVRAQQLLAQQAQQNQGQPTPNMLNRIQMAGAAAMSQAITSNPLPKLQLPPGRQRVSGSAAGGQMSMQSPSAGNAQISMSPSMASSVAQRAPSVTSPGGSANGTPTPRPAAVAAIQRGGTPSRMNPGGNRDPPSNAGSPAPMDTDAIAAVAAATSNATQSMNELMAGNQQYVAARQQAQTAPTNFPIQHLQQMQQLTAPSHLNISNLPRFHPNNVLSNNAQLPHIPGFQPVTPRSFTSETLAESAKVAPLPQGFPSRRGQRVTLTGGLGGTGMVIETPALSMRPATFDQLVKDLSMAMGRPGSGGKPARGALFDRPRAARDEREMLDEDLAIADEIVEEVEVAVEEAGAEDAPVVLNDRKRKIGEIAAGVQKNLSISEGVLEFMLETADEFVDTIIEFGCRLAKHRKVGRLEVKDVQYHLEREYGLYIPGFNSDTLRVDQVKADLETARMGAGTGDQSTSGYGKGSVNNRAARLAAVHQAKLAAAAKANE